MFEGKYLVGSGPVIVEEGKLLVIKDEKDDFYKLPGGRVEEEESDLEAVCKREFFEETKGKLEILKPLSSMIIWKNPTTTEKMAIVLIHYKAKLLNKEELQPSNEAVEVSWLDTEEIKEGKHNVSPNILFLLEKGELV